MRAKLLPVSFVLAVVALCAPELAVAACTDPPHPNVDGEIAIRTGQSIRMPIYVEPTLAAQHYELPI